MLQPTKGKVRLVFDFCEVNSHVECHTGGEVVDVYRETLRKEDEWSIQNGGPEIGLITI